MKEKEKEKFLDKNEAESFQERLRKKETMLSRKSETVAPRKSETVVSRSEPAAPRKSETVVSRSEPVAPRKSETVVTRESEPAAPRKSETVVTRESDPVAPRKSETVVTGRTPQSSIPAPDTGTDKADRAGRETPLSEEEKPEGFDLIYDFLMLTKEQNMDRADFEAGVKAQIGEKIEGLSGHTYVLGRVLSVGGESVILLCRNEKARLFAAKVHLDVRQGNHYSLKEVMSFKTRLFFLLKDPEARKYFRPIVDFGHMTLQKGTRYLVEFLPYSREGDLGQKGAMSVEQLLPLVQMMNEALHYIHSHNILHRDIKPENIFLMEDGWRIGDFGIACSLTSGQMRMTRVNAGTDEYMAPETLNMVDPTTREYLFGTEADYYAMGLTLGSLFAGQYVLQGMNARLIARTSHMPLPAGREDERKGQLQNLLDGLYQFDPKKRFGYEEVKRWLKDPETSVTSAFHEGWTQAYRFGGKSLTDEESMYEAFSQSWEEAKAGLFRGYVEDFFRTRNQELAGVAADIVENQSDDTSLGLFTFLRRLYPEGPLAWKGSVFGSLKELGEAMLKTEDTRFLEEGLRKGIVSDWASSGEGHVAKAETLRLIKEIEDLARRQPQMARYYFGYAFSDQASVPFLDQQITGPSDLVRASLSSAEVFYQPGGALDVLCARVSDSIRVAGFLCSKGYAKVLEEHWGAVSFEDGQEVRNATLVFGLLERLAQGEREIMSVRSAFLTFGPFAYLDYVRQLAAEGGYRVRGEGGEEEERLIRRIASAPEADWYLEEPIEKICDDLEGRRRDAEKLRGKLQNNPFLVLAHIYEGASITSTNIQGLFGYPFLGLQVPFGFSERLGQ